MTTTLNRLSELLSPSRRRSIYFSARGNTWAFIFGAYSKEIILKNGGGLSGTRSQARSVGPLRACHGRYSTQATHKMYVSVTTLVIMLCACSFFCVFNGLMHHVRRMTLCQTLDPQFPHFGQIFGQIQDDPHQVSTLIENILAVVRNLRDIVNNPILSEHELTSRLTNNCPPLLHIWPFQ